VLCAFTATEDEVPGVEMLEGVKNCHRRYDYLTQREKASTFTSKPHVIWNLGGSTSPFSFRVLPTLQTPDVTRAKAKATAKHGCIRCHGQSGYC